MDRYARLRMLPCRKQMFVAAIIVEGRSDSSHTLRGSGRGKAKGRSLVARGTAILREEASATSTEDVSGMRYDVIAPPTDAEGGLFSEINDNSVAILLTYGTARILLAGDAEANEEEYMANGTYTGPLTIKVTHHGSNTSSTPLFLSRFPPKVAVIQCGADNPYGHPTPETLDRLQRVGAKVFRNDEDRDVIATIKDQELKVATTKR